MADGKLPIGKPVANIKVYITDPDMNLCPIGVVGELLVGGSQIARGYLNRPELTKERFVPNPFATPSDIKKGYTRLYRTGDLGRWLPDGNIEYIGRNDDQVKIRGHRIELGEVETARSLLRQSEPLSLLRSENEDKYIELEKACSRTVVDVKQLYGGMSRQKRRNMVAKMLKGEVRSVPPSRSAARRR